MLGRVAINGYFVTYWK